MHPDKVLGPDGMNPCFFQHFWDLVGNDVTEACLFNLNNCFMLPSLNATSIILIMKIKKPEMMYEFKPIALCNVLYKIMAKVIANRLKSILLSSRIDKVHSFQAAR